MPHVVLLLVLFMTEAVWTAAEQRAWAPPERLTVSEWADRYRVLPVGISSEPGPWRTDRTPYLRAIMDAMGDDTTQEVVVKKTPQVGLSEATRNALGYWIDHDPAPCLIVFPTEPIAKENLAERVLPMLEATPQLRQYVTGDKNDLKASCLALRSMPIYPAWSNSPASLATRPCRYVVCDETDKYPMFSGKEASPIKLAGHRQTTYEHRKKLITLSTPTTKLGLIEIEWQFTPEAHRFRFHLPCPHCHVMQPLDWSRFRWGNGQTAVAGGELPEDEQERKLLSSRVKDGLVPVWYACSSCEDRITEADRHDMLAKGRWKSPLGYLDELTAKPTRLAFHIPSLYSPWVRWAQVVAAFLASRSDFSAMMDFMNGYLGEPFEEELNKLEATTFESKASKGFRRGVVPAWARYITASADTGGRDAWYTIRAWGPNYRSRLLDHGHVYSLEELRQRALNVRFEVEENVRPAMGVDILVVDSGGTFDVMEEHASRTDEVYRWSITDRRIAVVKGSIKGDRPVTTKRVTYKPPNGNAPYDVLLNVLNVHYYKDVLQARIHQTFAGAELWQLCEGVDQLYFRHMTAEHRVLIREGTKAKMAWVPISKGVANHWWDCEVYACAAADMLRVDLLPPSVDEVVVAPPVMKKTPTTQVYDEPARRPLVTRRPR